MAAAAAPGSVMRMLLLQCRFVLGMQPMNDVSVRLAFSAADYLSFIRYFLVAGIRPKRFLLGGIDQLAQLGFELFAFCVFHKNLFVVNSRFAREPQVHHRPSEFKDASRSIFAQVVIGPRLKSENCRIQKEPEG
jgi:hypothetical protein